jgi:hypothetical protein
VVAWHILSVRVLDHPHLPPTSAPPPAMDWAVQRAFHILSLPLRLAGHPGPQEPCTRSPARLSIRRVGHRTLINDQHLGLPTMSRGSLPKSLSWPPVAHSMYHKESGYDDPSAFACIVMCTHCLHLMCFVPQFVTSPASSGWHVAAHPLPGTRFTILWCLACCA